jgi:hypothetical protein
MLIDFDEPDLNNLLYAVRGQIANVKWDVTDDADWQQLKALKELQTRLELALDAAFDGRTA